MNIEFYENIENTSDLKYVVIVCRYANKWLLVKHKERTTWEIPGGHIEEGEIPYDAAKRELNEETGAEGFTIRKVSYYAVNRFNERSYGALYFAKITKLGRLPNFEIESTALFEKLPDLHELTYPKIQPALLARVIKDSLERRNNNIS